MKEKLPDFYGLIRSYRAEITRVKLAAEFDMGVGYTAVPRAVRGEGEPSFKLRYGLGSRTHVVKEEKEAGAETDSLSRVRVDQEVYQTRRTLAVNFADILGRRAGKNEIIIAIRHHAGPFPVYGIRQKGGDEPTDDLLDVIRVITLARGSPVLTDQTITAMGRIGRV